MNYTDARRQFATKLRNLRKEKNITQEQFAELINKSIEHISFLERGERSPSFELLVDVANAFGLTLSELFSDEQIEVPDDLIATIRLDPNIKPRTDLVSEFPVEKNEQSSDLERLQAALEGIRTMQRLADEYGVRDILQDNGGKVLQVASLLGLKISPSREGNDAFDAEGNEYELKTINQGLNKNAGVTTHHHLNKVILAKYRAVKAWIIAIYNGIELIEIYRVEPHILEPIFQQWEKKLDTITSINNPKIPMRFVRQGELVYPKDSTAR